MRSLIIFASDNNVVNDYLRDFSDEIFTINKNFKKLFLQIFLNEKKLSLGICKGLFFKPITLIIDLIFILKKRIFSIRQLEI